MSAHATQRGAAAVLLLILIGAIVALAAFVSDGTRLTSSAAQLKRATDAAAMAAAQAYAGDEDADIQVIAERYVNVNLGMDTAQTGNELVVSANAIEFAGDPGVRVTASFQALALLHGSDSTKATVASTAVARTGSLEVALALPNAVNSDARSLAALRRLGNDFAETLIGNRDNTWLSLVPYSQSVNVYDARHANRVRDWAAPAALRPVELTSLFRSRYGSLADARMPDRRARLLCMFRGLDRGENYFWDEAP